MITFPGCCACNMMVRMCMFNKIKKIFDWLSASLQSKFKWLSPHFQEVFIKMKWGNSTVRNVARVLTFQRRIILEKAQSTVAHVLTVIDYVEFIKRVTWWRKHEGVYDVYCSLSTFLCSRLPLITDCFLHMKGYQSGKKSIKVSLSHINNILHLPQEHMFGYFSADIICSDKRTGFRERKSRITASFGEQIMFADKYPSILIYAPNGGYCVYFLSNVSQHARL